MFLKSIFIANLKLFVRILPINTKLELHVDSMGFLCIFLQLCIYTYTHTHTLCKLGWDDPTGQDQTRREEIAGAGETQSRDETDTGGPARAGAAAPAAWSRHRQGGRGAWGEVRRGSHGGLGCLLLRCPLHAGPLVLLYCYRGLSLSIQLFLCHDMKC